MFSQLRDRIIEFINSEDGKVGVKTSLSLGLVGGGLLLMQTMFPSAAKADFECFNDSDCADDEICDFWKDESDNWHSECKTT
ncbi:hypothetical protein F4225_02055 [Candidatus Poribacteria bacterium]|nr:hypothetical protein [Candidatus Poribacteria bacterium]